MAHESLAGLFGVFLTGVFAGVFGSLVGLGGGFLVVPVLRLFFEISPAAAAGTALVFVFANTAAASITFLRRRVVDLKRGLTIAAAGLPTSIVGAYVVRLFSPRDFDTIYGAFLVALAIAVLLRRDAPPVPRDVGPRVQLLLEIVAGIAVGFFSSFFGIGGGIVIVPILLLFFRLPVHVVAATSAFIVMLTSPTGVITHGLYGDLDHRLAIPIVLGGLLGGTAGARLARHVSPRQLTGLLGAMLLLAAAALVLKHLL